MALVRLAAGDAAEVAGLERVRVPLEHVVQQPDGLLPPPRLHRPLRRREGVGGLRCLRPGRKRACQAKPEKQPEQTKQKRTSEGDGFHWKGLEMNAA